MRCLLARRVYRYWREQGFSPSDARMMVDGFVVRYNERIPA